MRAVIQRVHHASITIDRKDKRSIERGLLVLLGIEDDDSMEDITWLSGKISRLRVFPDDRNVMNLSLLDIKGDIMIVSQFTLHASTRKGNRPSYTRASSPDIAIPLYESFISQMEQDLSKSVVTGRFGAYMEINLLNDGPVTLIIDTKNRE